jgi:hypothetical protein
MEFGVDNDYSKQNIESMINNFANQYNTDDPYQFADNYNIFYQVGKDSKITSFKDALNKVPELENSISIIGEDAAGTAFSQGRQLVTPIEESTLKQVPKGRFINDTNKSGAVFDFAEGFANWSGADVIATETPEKYVDNNVKSDSIRGLYVGSKGQIIIDTKYASVLRTLNHEAGHLTSWFAPEEANVVATKCMDFARNSLGIEGVDNAIKNIQDEYESSGKKISYSEAQDEFIQNIIGTAMASEDGITTLANNIFNDKNISEKQKKSIIGKLIDWVKDLIKRLTKISEAGGEYEDTEFVKEDAKQRKDIIDSQIKALEQTKNILDQLNNKSTGSQKSGSVSDEETKYSLTNEQKEISTEYNKAVADNDIKKAADLVQQYAKSKGYDTKVYHGTQDFGFTQIDLSKSDDNTTFWATSSLETAQTYSGKDEVRQINKDIIQYENLSKSKKAELWKEAFEINDSLEYIDKNDIKKQKELVNKQIDEIEFYLGEMKPKVKELKSILEKAKDLFGKIKNNPYSQDAIVNTLSLDSLARNEYNIIKYDYDNEEAMPVSMYGELEKRIRLITEKTGAYLRNNYSIVFEDRVDRDLERFSDYNKGNYQFYANTDNFKTVDAEGKNWDRIEYNTIQKPTIKNIENYLCSYFGIEPENILYNEKNKTFNYDIFMPDVEDFEEDSISLKEAEKLFEERKDVLTTRQIAEDAVQNNYDGVLIKNLIDNGGRGNFYYEGADDVYIFFNPTEQVKSADTVTYDDNGEVVPLEKRFDPEYDDIRYSLAPTEDSESRELSKEQQDYFKDSKIRNKNTGKLLVMYHGTKTPGFNVFDIKKASPYGMHGSGFYFTTDSSHAKQYGGSAYKVYLNVVNPLTSLDKTHNITKEQLTNFVKAIADNEDYGLDNYGQNATVKSVVNNIWNNGNTDDYSMLNDLDATCIGDFVKAVKLFNEVNNTNYDGIRGDSETIVWNPNQIKNIDNTNPTTNEDIRYSVEKDDTLEIDRIEREAKTKALSEANKALYNTILEMKGKKLPDYNLLKIAMNLKEAFNIDLSNRTIKEQLDKVNNAIKNSNGDITTDEVNKAAADVMKSIMRYSNGIISEENQDILKDIKSYKIKLSDKLKAGITDYGKWFRENQKNFTIRKDGIDIDSLWQEWVEKYPQYFSADINEGDMPYQLEAITNTLRKGIEYGTRESDIEDYKTELLYEFANQFEKKDNNLNRAMNKLNNILEREMQDRVREAIDEISEFKDIEIAEMKYRSKKEARELKEKKETTRVRNQNKKMLLKLKRAFTYPTIKNRVPEVLKNTLGDFLNAVDPKEMARLDYYNKRIRNLENRLEMTTGEEYNEVKRDLAAAIDRKNRLETAFIDFAETYKRKGVRDSLEQQGEFSEPLMDSLNNLIPVLENRSIMDFNLEEQQELNRALRMLQVEINNYNKIIDNSIIGEDGKAKHISELVLEANNEVKNRESDKKFFGNILNAKTDFVTKNLRPDTVFNRIGGNHKNNIWLQSAENLKDGTRDSMRVQQKAYNTFGDFLENNKEARDLQKYDDKHLYKTGLINDKGEEIKLPKGMIIMLKMHLMNPNNRAHLIGGGLTVPNFEKYYKGKGGLDSKQQIFNGVDSEVNSINKDIAKELNETDPDFKKIKEWDNQINTILKDGEKIVKRVEQALDKVLTDFDREYIKKHFEVFDGLMKEELNKVTQKRFGVDLAQVDKYVRLISDKDYFTKMNEGGYGIETNIENTGWMKQRTGARNPIILEDALNADIDQIKKSADYIGFLIPQHNFNRLLKYTTVKRDANGNILRGKDRKPIRVNLTKTLRRNYPGALKYIEDLKMDLFGGKPSVDSGFLSTIQSGVAIQGLVNNPRVELMQLASYPFAAVELGFKPITKALVKGGKKGRIISRADREVIDEKTPLLWYRESQRGAMSEIAQAKNNKTGFGKIYSKIVNTKGGALLFGRIEKMDLAAVGRTWYACEYKVRQDKSIKVGSDEYWEKVVDLFNKSTERTQPNYVPITRNYYQRSNNPLFRFMEMFKTVLNQMNNEVYDAQATYRAYKEDYENGGKYNTSKKDVKDAFHKRNRAIIAYVLSHSLVMAIRILVKGTLLHKGWNDITDEDDDKLSGEKMTKYFTDTMFSNILSGFVMGNEIADSFNALTDKIVGNSNKYHPDFNLSPIQIISDAFNNIKSLDDLTNEKKRAKRLKSIAMNLSTLIGVPYRNSENFVKGMFGMIEDIVDDSEYNYSNDLEDSKALKKYILGDIDKKQVEKVIAIDDNAKTKFANAVKNLYQKGKINEDKAISAMKKTNLWDSDTRKQPTESYVKGKIEWWNIENKYKDEYVSTLTENGAQTKESNKVIAKIAKMPYSNAFYVSPDANTSAKNYKSSYEKLINRVKKWKPEK